MKYTYMVFLSKKMQSTLGVLCIFLCSLAQADTSTSIYDFVYNSCSTYVHSTWNDMADPDLALSHSFAKGNTDLSRQILTESFKNAFLKFKIFNIQSTKDLINHPDFGRAVTDCFPNDPKSAAAFVTEVMKADITGKITATFARVS